MRKEPLVAIACAAVMAVGVANVRAGLAVGEIPMDWTVPNSDGGNTTLYDYQGDIIVADWVGLW